MQFIDAIAIAEFVQKVRRERRREIQRPHLGFFTDLAVVSGWPWRQVVVVRVVVFPDPRSAQSMFLVEIVIDLDIDLVPVVRVDDSLRCRLRNLLLCAAPSE